MARYHLLRRRRAEPVLSHSTSNPPITNHPATRPRWPPIPRSRLIIFDQVHPCVFWAGNSKDGALQSLVPPQKRRSGGRVGRRRCARGWEVTASHPVSKPHHQTACQPSTHGVRRWLYGWVVMDDGWMGWWLDEFGSARPQRVTLSHRGSVSPSPAEPSRTCPEPLHQQPTHHQPPGDPASVATHSPITFDHF